jgi:hypothetical protein
VKVLPAIVSVPLRGVVAVFAATLNVTEPLPDPLEPAVTVIQLALLVAVHPHPAVAATLALPVLPPAGTAWLSGVTVGVAQLGVKENVLETALRVEPPGPLAPTRDSYTTSGTSGVLRRATKSRRIRPSGSGDGIPRSTVWTMLVSPAR